ncbi:sigma-70 family RNA polymerase sigma factor [Iamia majanohamensis]|uniref:Sigma-70 family RNA polymerase sigma factor n=1 Tax=Iamia majanohamensis TaxID=467976 RepID=A0AAF0BX84_9ACTN|nr:sigma-70 family RNA polymerase sigma factor [Iamia majanohamensis]WCO68785.1 sigma-70 family RNA polymerase sigma factor [Iamia majanohamensis]
MDGGTPVAEAERAVPSQAAARRPDGVDELCRALHPRLLGSLRLYLGDAETARELTQDALVRVIERWPSVQTMDHPEAWAYRVAFNLARSRLRRATAERRARARTTPVPPGRPDVDVAASIAVRRAVALLPPRQRQAVVLRYYGDLSLAEVAAVMGCRPGTVKAHLHQALTGLRLAGLADETDVADGEPTRPAPDPRPEPAPRRPEDAP